MASQEAHPVVVTMETQIVLLNESVQTAEEAVEKVTEKAGRVSTEMMSGKSGKGKANSATTKGTPRTVPTGVPVFTQLDQLKLRDAVAELEVHRGSLVYAQQGTSNGIQVGRALMISWNLPGTSSGDEGSSNLSRYWRSMIFWGTGHNR